jgi:hypothetical protein
MKGLQEASQCGERRRELYYSYFLSLGPNRNNLREGDILLTISEVSVHHGREGVAGKMWQGSSIPLVTHALSRDPFPPTRPHLPQFYSLPIVYSNFESVSG